MQARGVPELMTRLFYGFYSDIRDGQVDEVTLEMRRTARPKAGVARGRVEGRVQPVGLQGQVDTSPDHTRAAIGEAVPGRIGTGRPVWSVTKACGSIPQVVVDRGEHVLIVDRRGRRIGAQLVGRADQPGRPSSRRRRGNAPFTRRPVVATRLGIDLRRPAELAPDDHGHVLVESTVVDIINQRRDPPGRTAVDIASDGRSSTRECPRSRKRPKRSGRPASTSLRAMSS